jgi:uncharacterized protein
MKPVSAEFLVEGYNLLHALFKEKNKRDLESLREQMETSLRKVQHASGRRVTVVYDGKACGSPQVEPGALERVFTPARTTADEWITTHIRSRGPKSRLYTVVSSDRAVSSRSKAFGAMTMSSEEFILQWIDRPRSRTFPAHRTDYSRKTSPGTLSEKEVEAWMRIFKEKG